MVDCEAKEWVRGGGGEEMLQAEDVRQEDVQGI